MKYCSGCKQEKATTEFWKCTLRTDGLQDLCKVCLGARNKGNRDKKSPEQLRTDRQYHYQNQKEHRKQYQEVYTKTPKGRAVMIANASRRRSQMKDTDITSEWVLELRESSTHCPVCGVELCDKNYEPNNKHLDHIVPLAVGGEHVKANVRIICEKCNKSRPKDGSDVLKEIA